jgi:hypothetical protein
MLLAIFCLLKIAFQNICQRSGPSEIFPLLIIALIPRIIHTLAVQTCLCSDEVVLFKVIQVFDF